VVTNVKVHSREINKLINNHPNSLTCKAYLVYVLSGIFIYTLFKN
jgi:hypothetical protein